jgi:hypothetical protein
MLQNTWNGDRLQALLPQSCFNPQLAIYSRRRFIITCSEGDLWHSAIHAAQL